MSRVKRGMRTRARHHKILKQAKGYFGHKSKLFKVANQAVLKSGVYAYRDRKNKKRDFRKLWINELEFKELLRHPYLNYKQVRAIMNLRKKKGNIASIHELVMLDEFTSEDIFRIEPYLAF